MSQYTVTLVSTTERDSDAMMGFDGPLRTFFIQGFPDEDTEEPSLWLGSELEEFRTLEALEARLAAIGCKIVGLDDDARLALHEEAAAPHAPSALERAGWNFRS